MRTDLTNKNVHEQVKEREIEVRYPVPTTRSAQSLVPGTYWHECQHEQGSRAKYSRVTYTSERSLAVYFGIHLWIDFVRGTFASDRLKGPRKFSAIFTRETTFLTFFFLLSNTKTLLKRVWLFKGKNLFPREQCIHYENKPIQIYWKFYHKKNEKCQIKILMFSILLLKT